MGQCQSATSAAGNTPQRTASGRLVSRDLSAFERLAWKATPYASIAHWFQVESESVPVSTQALAEALRIVHRQYAPLQSVIEKKRMIQRPELTPEITIDEEADVSPQGLAALAGDEASDGLGPCFQACEGRLLWRARVMRNGWVMLTFHHAIIDERSITMLMQSVLTVLSKELSQPSKMTLAPKLTELLDKPGPSWRMFLEQRHGGRLPGKAIGRIADLALSPRKDTTEILREGSEWPAPQATANWEDRRSKACVRTLELSSALRCACREHGLTVNAALVAALALGLRHRISRKGKVSMRPILAVDARMHIPDSQDLFGSYSLGGRFKSGFKSLAVDASTDFWDLADQAKSLVQDVSEKAEVHKISWYMRFLVSAMGKKGVPWLNGALDLNGPNQGRTNALLVSNTGVLKGMAAGEYQVAQSFFCVSPSSLGPVRVAQCIQHQRKAMSHAMLCGSFT
mmetsp:Transcript_12666/g.22394  ORF Transcript_12666/g.22394 Transcript_12666/m.22394 type:complete len:457 (-) Transcript_12666:219-1589(-)